MPIDFLETSSDKININFKKVNVYPANENIQSRLKFTFLIVNFIPKNSVMRIKLSPKILILNTNSNIQCFLKKGVYLFKNCKSFVEGSDKYIDLEILENYSANEIIELSIIGYSLIRIDSDLNSEPIT